ncbi:MAG: YkgJ family cysteine cluster protein, partial [Proteobacteria bacterium]|nr:YkgJ family cysteine cluster protein [Pseudomonadota bacterium]
PADLDRVHVQNMIDLPEIAALAEPHWADNWNFRSYLQQKVSPETIDDVAQKTYREVAAQIDCTQCGQCCREIQPYLTAQDVLRLSGDPAASGNQMPLLRKDEESGLQVFCQKPCPMLKNNQCTAYDLRPDDCRSYPHLDRPDFLGGSVGFIENYGTCPIIFHTYGRMKTRFSYDSSTDYIGDSNPEQV